VAEIFEIFTTCTQVSILQDPTVTCNKNKFQNLVLVLEMAVLECFWHSHSHDPLGVKIHFQKTKCQKVSSCKFFSNSKETSLKSSIEKLATLQCRAWCLCSGTEFQTWNM